MVPANKRRILLIDDQASIHDDYRKIICAQSSAERELSDAEAELFGDVQANPNAHDHYEVDSAFCGEDAIALVEQALDEGRPYAVAFVDIRMPPGLDGVCTVRRIWEIDCEILVVLCSAYSDYSWEDISSQLGRTDRFLILRKPFDSIEVRQCAAALAVRWQVARTDPLTGLLNRRSFEEQLRREWAQAVHDDYPLSCVMIDIDYFKSINDREGHAAGDQALRQVSATLAFQARPGDIVCRYGGEEFCVLMPGAAEAEAAGWAERVRQDLAAKPLLLGSHPVTLTASFGVAVRRNSQDELVQSADRALRDAKASGRNRVITWRDREGAAHDVHWAKKYSVLFRELSARDLMTAPITCLPRKTPVADAADLLLCRQVSSAPVVDPDGMLVGIVAERDIMDALAVTDGWNAPVERFMTTRVIQYPPETPAAVIFEFLSRVQIHRVVIVEHGRPVGLVSRGTFLRWAQNYVQAIGPLYNQTNARPNLLLTADALTRRARDLQDKLQSSSDVLLAPVVSGVSSMQDMMSDLLTWARCTQVQPISEQCVQTP
jgi:diguanylate cyclase (GGDEF)-like protein